MTAKTNTLPVISLPKGTKLTEEVHEKYGTSLQFRVSSPPNRRGAAMNVELDGKLYVLSLFKKPTGELDSEGNEVWASFAGLKEIQASVPKKVEPKSLKTSEVVKGPSEADMEMFAKFKAFMAATK